MPASLYEPIDVYKPVAASIGFVDGPFEYLTVAGVRLPLPFPTRMTVVRLSSGDLWLHSPVRFERRLADALASMGRIRHLVSPNQFHYAHIGEWLRAFPEAVAWASPGVRRRSKARHADIRFDRDLGPQLPVEWREDLDQALFPGGYFKEYIFFHRESRTLVVADAIINLDLDKMDQPWRMFTRMSGMYHPHGQVFFGMRLPLKLQPGKRRAMVAKLREWRPDRILLSHGRCFETGAGEAIGRIFGEPA